MVRVEDAVIARYKHEGETFEILVDADLAMALKNGREINFNDLLAADAVFKDARKGDEKSEQTVSKVFGTSDIQKIARKIILDGEVQLTTDQRRKMMEAKRKEIVSLIARNAMNPQTQAPHPIPRIETALEEAKFHVDLHKPSTEQMKIAIDAIRKLIPISLDNLRIAVKVPAQYSGKATVILHKYDIKQEEWQNDGSLVVLLELPAGVKVDLMNELNNLTHGAVGIKILDKK